MDKERFLQSGLLEQYVLGLTTEEENEEVERYARAFPEIKSEINLLRNAVKQYAKEQIAIPSVKKNQRSGSPGASNKIRPSRPVNQWLMAACLALFGIFGIYQYAQKEGVKQEINQLNRNFVAYRADCEKEQQAMHELATQVAFYQHHRTSPFQLKGTSLAPNSRVRVFWNDIQQMAMLQVLSLPDQPENKQYQIWADIDGEMVDLGLINYQSEEPQAIRCLPKAASLNITLEPLGGSKEPHVDQLYANVNLQ